MTADRMGGAVPRLQIQRFPVYPVGAAPQSMTPGMVPGMTTVPGIFGAVPPKDPAEVPMRTTGAVTRGMALGADDEQEFTRYLSGITASADNEASWGQQLHQWMRERGFDGPLREALFRRARAYYKEAAAPRVTAAVRARRMRGATPDGKKMRLTMSMEKASEFRKSGGGSREGRGDEARAHEALAGAHGIAKFNPELVKADARGGKYHARVTSDEGKHRYFYSPEAYAASGKAHVRGQEIQRDRIRKEILDRVGQDGAPMDSIRDLGDRYDSGMVTDLVKEMTGSGMVREADGRLMPGMDVQKGPAPRMTIPQASAGGSAFTPPKIPDQIRDQQRAQQDKILREEGLKRDASGNPVPPIKTKEEE